MANLKLLNPDFEYWFFDDDHMRDFVNDHFPAYRSILESFRYPIQRYDFFRYLAVYQLGGFYFDVDIFLAKGLSELLNSSCVFPFEELTLYRFLRLRYGIDWEIGNYAFAASPGHSFLLSVINNCVKAQKDPKWAQEMMVSIPRIFRKNFYIYISTGPALVTRTLAEYPDASRQVKVLFPENVCDLTKWGRFGEFGVHLMGGTWRKRKTDLKGRLLRVWMTWTRNKLLKESLRLGESRSLDFVRKS